VEFSNLYNELLKFPYFRYQAEDNNLVTEEEWFSACNNYQLTGIFKALIRCSTDTVNRNDVIWGDKSPSYICHIDLLKHVYPSAKFIHIVRDVRDYVLSISTAWGKNKLRAAQRWADSLDKLQKDAAQFRNDVFTVKYEDLIDDHERVLRNALQFLGLPFDERVLKLSAPSENLGDAKGATIVLRGNKDKYKEFLTEKEILGIEILSGSTMARYGYPVQYKEPRRRLPLVREKYYQLLDGINLVLFERQNRGLWGALAFYWTHFRATRVI